MSWVLYGLTALTLFAIVLFATLRLVRSPFGRTLVAIRENEERMRMLGYDVFRSKLAAGLFCAAAGAAEGVSRCPTTINPREESRYRPVFSRRSHICQPAAWQASNPWVVRDLRVRRCFAAGPRAA